MSVHDFLLYLSRTCATVRLQADTMLSATVTHDGKHFSHCYPGNDPIHACLQPRRERDVQQHLLGGD